MKLKLLLLKIDRSIGDTIRLIEGILDYTADCDIPGILLTIDFEKAFDKLEWSFLFKALDSFNFGPNFVQWVKTLYSNISSCVMNNGSSTGYFSLFRGVRQGDPISPLLFILALEIFLTSVRSNKDIKGITFEETELKNASYADDLTCFLKDVTSANHLFILLKNFQLISGLTVNNSKCEAMWLGKWRNDTEKPLGVKWPDGVIKICGIYISYNKSKTCQLNFAKPIERLKMCLNFWKMRDLTLLGKVQIIKALGISRFLYVLNLTEPQSDYFKQINKLLFSFLWNGPDKVSRSTVIGSIKEGGLGMPDVYAIYKAQRINWLRRFSDDDVTHPWKLFLNRKLKLVGGIKILLKCNFDVKYLPLALSDFERNMLKTWNELTCDFHSNSFLNQCIWNNRHIIISGKSVFYKDLYNAVFFYVGDLFDRGGKPLEWSIVEEKVMHCNVMKWYSIIYSLP